MSQFAVHVLIKHKVTHGYKCGFFDLRGLLGSLINKAIQDIKMLNSYLFLMRALCKSWMKC